VSLTRRPSDHHLPAGRVLVLFSAIGAVDLRAIQLPHVDSHPRPSSSQHSASTECPTARWHRRASVTRYCSRCPYRAASFHPDGGDIFLRNVSNKNHTASHSRRRHSSQSADNQNTQHQNTEDGTRNTNNVLLTGPELWHGYRHKAYAIAQAASHSHVPLRTPQAHLAKHAGTLVIGRFGELCCLHLRRSNDFRPRNGSIRDLQNVHNSITDCTASHFTIQQPL
jgi:hypothetical protein